MGWDYGRGFRFCQGWVCTRGETGLCHYSLGGRIWPAAVTPGGPSQHRPSHGSTCSFEFAFRSWWCFSCYRPGDPKPGGPPRLFREGLQHVDKPHGQKWDRLWPVNTLFAYKDPPLDIDECPSVPDPLLVHRFCVVNGFLQYTSPEFIYATNQLASLYKSSGPHHVKAMDYALWYLAGTTSLALRIGPKDEEEIVAVLLLLRDFGLSLTKIPLLVDNQARYEYRCWHYSLFTVSTYRFQDSSLS